MVGQARVSIAYQHERTFDMGSLRRLAIWGGSAAVALLVAVLAGYSDANSRRLMAADAQTTGTPAAQLASRLPEIDAQTQRLAGVVDGLAADRELLMARIATLERNLEDVTGAIKRQGGDSSGQMSAVPPAPSPTAAVPAPAPTDSPKEPIKEVVKEAPPPRPLLARTFVAHSGRPALRRSRGATGTAGAGRQHLFRSVRRPCRGRAAQDRVRRRRRRRGEFRRPAGALGLDQGQSRGPARGSASRGRRAREQPDEKRGAAAGRRAAGQRRGRRPPVRKPLGGAPLLPAGRVRGSAADRTRRRARTYRIAETRAGSSGAGTEAEGCRTGAPKLPRLFQ